MHCQNLFIHRSVHLSMVFQAQGIFPFICSLSHIMVHQFVLIGHINNSLGGNLQPRFRHVQVRILSWSWNHYLNVLTVKLCVVVSQLWSLEVLSKNVGKFGWSYWKTSQKLFISVVISWHIQGRTVAVEQILHVSSGIIHAVYDSGGKLTGGSLHCDLTVVKNTEISSAQSSISFIWLNKMNFQVAWQFCGFCLNLINCLVVFWQYYKNFKEILADTLDLSRGQKFIQAWNALSKCKIDLFWSFSWSYSQYVMVLVDTFGLSETLSGFLYQVAHTKITK